MTLARRAASCLLVLLLSASSVAFAFPGGRGDHGGGYVQQRQPQRERPYQPPPRRDNYAPQQPQQPQRMTPDERRQLRRDLHDAGRDVYPQRREWRR